MERGTRLEYTTRLMGIFKGGRSTHFTRRNIDLMTNKYRVERCGARIGRGNFAGAESDASIVLDNCRYFSLPRSRRGNGNTRRMCFGACLFCPYFKRITELECSQIAHSLHQMAVVLQKKGDFDGAESHYRTSLELPISCPTISAVLHVAVK